MQTDYPNHSQRNFNPQFDPYSPINQQQYQELREDIVALRSDMEHFDNNYCDLQNDFDDFRRDTSREFKAISTLLVDIYNNTRSSTSQPRPSSPPYVAHYRRFPHHLPQ